MKKINLPKQNSCKIAILGLGYVGLPLALEIARIKKCLKTSQALDRKIIGFDINKIRIKELINKKNKSELISNQKSLDEFINLTFTSELKDLTNCEVFIVAVPTPIDNARRPDFSALKSACELIGKVLFQKNNDKTRTERSDPIIIFESTVYPGATEEICVPILESISKLNSNLNGGFFYGYSPERINPGDLEHQISSIKKIVSGSNNDVANWLENFYGSFIYAGIHLARCIKVAEAAKVIENTQRDLNIALINELAVICDLLKIDTSEVVDAASTKWNFHDFRPGLVGGHCIGIDPYYLTHKAEKLGYHPEVVLAGRRINDNMSKWLSQKLLLELSKRNLLNKDSEILILGFTYKANCPDVRNSQISNVINIINTYNIKTYTVDPVADKESAIKIYNQNVSDNVPFGKKFSAVLLAVAHEDFLRITEKEWEDLIFEGGFLFDLCNTIPRSLNPLRI